MCLVATGGTTLFDLRTSVKLNEPEILEDDALDMVIEPLLPL
jgi:hypothetical protein